MCDTTFFSANVGRDNDEPSFYQGVETGKAFYGGEAVETDLRWAVTVMSTGHWLRVFDVQRSLIFSVTKLNNGKYDGNRSPSEYIPSLDMTIDEVWEKYYRSPDYVKKLLDSSL
ncbi:hypothetical protein GCM10007895_20620 [Paraferrimonas sedimenticola]|uniref:Uncharacterized protein n=2 Tax=Paraferrimonas sedimenticola TaxID=375674 RepID=A0AA37RWL9_9GAMM|nr:hypothetical protein GCM10007895_20620 [Paraferrimonas sedimenticola]